MKINRNQLKIIIKEEITNKRIDESLNKKDYFIIRKLIRAELATIMFVLFKKKQMWI